MERQRQREREDLSNVKRKGGNEENKRGNWEKKKE
jgi:hypothetical protein